MAASMHGTARLLMRISPSVILPLRHYQSCLQRLPVGSLVGSPVGSPVGAWSGPASRRFLCDSVSLEDEGAAAAPELVSRYSERPWEYLDSEEYSERYGTMPVWTGYRRNHKGGIPPQKTRKTCIRGSQICGNPCPICRDPDIIVHPQNVKLLQQFISPQSGHVYDPTKTGVCMRQQKRLNEAISTARDNGLLPSQVPYVDFSGQDYSNSHDAVGSTPPPPSLSAGDQWYSWYGQAEADQAEVAKVRKTYRAYLRS